MPDPLLYEINTRCWLRDLAQTHKRPVTLGDVPETEFREWQRLGFTHIWLMGVWTSGPLSRAKALEHEALRCEYSEALSGWSEQDVGASPYAIAAYKVNEELGGESGLAAFRTKLRSFGLRLVLDFVPNHVGLDHPWVSQKPGMLVHSATQVPDTFAQQTTEGKLYLAYGKDPNCPAWTDTVQLDYRRTATRDAMTKVLLAIAQQCDGVRCDMAMLVLNDVFASTWQRFPIEEPATTEEFWGGAVAAVRQAHPGFQFLAEVYWGIEGRLQDLGFDFTYDKTLYDLLLAQDSGGVQRHLRALPPARVRGSAHFLENHDERRIAAMLDLPAHRAAALVILGLPGMRFLHEGQLSGCRRKLPVQLIRREREPVSQEIRGLYEQLLAALHKSLVGQGSFTLLEPAKAWADNPTEQNFVLGQWSGSAAFDLVAVNLAPHRGQCFAKVTLPNTSGKLWSVSDLLGSERFIRPTADLRSRGLYLDLDAHQAQILRFEETPGPV